MEILIVFIIQLLVCFAIGWFFGSVISGSSRFSLRYKVPAEVQDNFPVLRDGYRWRPQRSLMGLHRIYVQKKTKFGWSPVEWNAFSGGVGDMARLSDNLGRWFMQPTGSMASAMGYLLESNPHLLPDQK